ncbi:NACHT domain-containing protein [Nostoc commune]|uniref:NACHT domain-containing protein n=1 Tax=Nostoc commune TaxID=1178 RepID=UPI0018C49248|nr:NACHT domain-containing NTPase [Nostoc commune]MBG1262846.1 NACHT domain-containing NTPase [Nostoc commune BAE]
MAKRSLQASLNGIQEAKRGFARKGWTQDNLAAEVNLKTRQPIWRFFSGRPVERHTFIEICSVLQLNWREIATNPPTDFLELEEYTKPSVLDIDSLVEKVRSLRFDKIQDQCGILQLWDISHPVALNDIYIDVNILEEIESLQLLDILKLQKLSPEEFDRFGLGEIDQKQIPGMKAVETYSKLRVLGKSGVGKTTFLQYLAIQCNQSAFAANLVPIFITLRNFAQESKVTNEFSLLKYIRQEFLTSGISDASVIETLLNAGRVLLLLDGMDEVLKEQTNSVLSEVRRFSDKYHKNQFVAACRTATQKLRLRGFTDVEIAPFTSEQIRAFAKKWFVTFSKTNIQDGHLESVQFIQKLDLDENWQFRQLVVTPLFLHLACWVFHGQEKFPTKRTDFYKQALDLLLGKWDEAKGIERDEVYRGFLLPQKVKLLSQIAAATFEQGQYFFEQRIVEQYIGDYIQNLTNVPMDSEELQIESEAALKSIEAQHGLLAERARGIFSFSYLAFQEYFTARKIVASHNLEAFGQALEGLVSHMTDPHWHEIFLLTATMLRSADSLVQLMKQQIDALVSEDHYLQEFLTWASQKSRTIPSEAKDATIRAFYLALSRSPRLASRFALASSLDQGMFLDTALDDLLLECAIDGSQDFAHIHACGDALSNILGIVLDVGLYKSLQQLSEQLPNSRQSEQRFTLWWQTNYSAWAKQLNMTVINYRNINHQWQFSLEQEQVLQRYYDANQLLLDCLHSNCEVTPAIRQEIEATLLLPQKELEDREWQ